MALEALIFDVDGTLAETERDGHRVAFNRAFAEAGLPWRWDIGLYGELLAVAGGKPRIRHYVARYRPDFRPPADFDALVSSLHAAKTRHYTAMLREDAIRLGPGVKRLLAEARDQGVRLAIATTAARDSVRALLASALGPDAESWFAVIGAGDVVPAKKPAPDIYHYVLARLGLRPAECLAFEDSEAGLRAALAAGLKTVVAVNDYTRGQDFSGAALVLDHFGEPDRPARVLAAAVAVNGVVRVDLELLKRLHAS